jgi:hypothetical protein
MLGTAHDVYVDLYSSINIYCDENTPGQGSKVCPFTDKDNVRRPHTTASRAAIEQRLRADREHLLEASSPSRDIFQRTSAFLTALRRSGCSAPLYEPTSFNLTENQLRETHALHTAKLQRGYLSSGKSCEGRLIFEYDFYGKPFLR